GRGVEVPVPAARADPQRVHRGAAVHRGRRLPGRAGPPPVGGALLRPGPGGAQPRHEHGALPARLGPARRHPRRRRRAQRLLLRRGRRAARAEPGEGGHGADHRARPHGPRRGRLPRRAVRAVVPQGAGGGGRVDVHPAHRGAAGGRQPVPHRGLHRPRAVEGRVARPDGAAGGGKPGL
ncbi:MAG: Ferritin, partial [uncultured Pseudonocardia sp.]